MMKKTFVTGILAAALIVGGGTGVYIASAKEKTVDMGTFMEQQGFDFNQMKEMMNSGNFEAMQNVMENINWKEMQKFMEEGNINFGQMKPYMKEMHPNLSDQQLEELYKDMHGTGGSFNSNNFHGMMGNFR